MTQQTQHHYRELENMLSLSPFQREFKPRDFHSFVDIKTRLFRRLSIPVSSSHKTPDKLFDKHGGNNFIKRVHVKISSSGLVE